MIQLEIGIDSIGGYRVLHIADVANWPTWPIKAKLTVKMEPGAAIELKVGFEYMDLKMEFTVLKV